MIDIRLIVYIELNVSHSLSATFLVNDERPCPMEIVTFTCTSPGTLISWSLSDLSVNIIVDRGINELNMALMQQGYTVTLTAFNNTSLTSTLSRTAENGVRVTCLDPPNDEIGSTTIQLAGESNYVLLTVNNTCIHYLLYTVPPSPPQRVSHSVESSSADEVSVTVGWDSPTETGGRDDLTYTVTISPPAQLSATVLTSTSVTVTAQYNVDYNVSVVATNCAGNSTTAEYSFMIGKLAALKNQHTCTFPIPSQAAVLC